MERAEHARARGAKILGYVAGYGASNDAFHMTQPDKEGRGAEKAMRAALSDAGATPQEVGYINAHGTSTPFNDRIETRAIHSVFNGGSPPVSSTKSAIGHLLGAAGAVEAVAVIGVLQRGLLPPTLNFEETIPTAIWTTCPTARARRRRSRSRCRTRSASADRTRAWRSGRPRDHGRPVRRTRHLASRSSTSRRSRRAARIDLLCDDGSFQPIRSSSGDGVIAGAGRIGGRPVYVWAQNVKHKGGSLGQAGGETIVSTIAAADKAGAPVVGYLHSGGARLQEGVHALGAYASIFRATSRATVPQISVICGPCAGGGAYSPSLGTLVMMVGDGAQMFLTGPRVIAKVTREIVTGVDLGGPRVHRKTGVSHLEADEDAEASALIRQALSYFPDRAGGPLPVRESIDPLPGDPFEPLPANPRHVYDVRDVIGRLVDGGEFLELSKRYAKNIVTGFGRIEGHPLGVIANQARYLGGVLDAASSDKAAWFVNLCDRWGIPLVVLSDTPGFRPGVRQEREAVLRRGAELLRAFAVAEIPRVTVTMRQAYGGAYIAMNCRDLGNDLTLAWPGAKIGVMGAPQAIEIVNRRDLEAGADPVALADAYAEQHLPVEIAAKAGFIDEIVAPDTTRERIAAHFEARR